MEDKKRCPICGASQDSQDRKVALLRGYRKYLADRMDEFNSGAMAERMLEELQRIEESQ